MHRYARHCKKTGDREAAKGWAQAPPPIVSGMPTDSQWGGSVTLERACARRCSLSCGSTRCPSCGVLTSEPRVALLTGAIGGLRSTNSTNLRGVGERRRTYVPRRTYVLI